MTNNVMMTNEDKKLNNRETIKQIEELEHKIKFVQDVDKLLKRYKLPKDYLYLAAKRSEVDKDRHLYNVEVETFVNSVYDGNASILVHGTEKEVIEFQKEFSEKLKKHYEEDNDPTTLGDSYYTEIELPLMLGQ